MEEVNIHELLLIASVEFSTANKDLFIEFLKEKHPYLHQVYIQIEGEG